MRKKLTKAIFPVAGLGTRFLPATKSVPKEIMTLVDRPLIQYAIDEARAQVAAAVAMPPEAVSASRGWPPKRSSWPPFSRRKSSVFPGPGTSV